MNKMQTLRTHSVPNGEVEKPPVTNPATPVAVEKPKKSARFAASTPNQTKEKPSKSGKGKRGWTQIPDDGEEPAPPKLVVL